MTTIDYSQKIPNNVDLASDKRLQRALERLAARTTSIGGPRSRVRRTSTTKDVYLRTAVSVDSDGWAHYGYVQMPDYRWGIFLEPRDEKDRTDRLRRPLRRPRLAAGPRRVPQLAEAG